MFQTKSSKRFAFIGVLFCAFAIVFALLYYFNVISNLDLYLSVTYVSYFVGLALMYNGAYAREHGFKPSTITNFVFGAIFMIASIILLVYGLASGLIVMF